MSNVNCSNFEKCEASLCPEDTESLTCGIWYPDEAICRKKEHRGLPFVRNQNKIKLRTNKGDAYDTYYTIKMLEIPRVVRSGIKGLDPDKVETEQLVVWLRRFKRNRNEANRRQG